MTIKQHSPQWHALRDQARLTGSTIFQALGCATLRDQKSHSDKVYNGTVTKVAPELQALFDYGSLQEINALATLLGKILPVYFPHLIFKENGCCIVPLNDLYAVISGDGSGVDVSNNTNITFEFKCPKPDNERVVDQHYTLPVRYTTQILAQMQAKNWEPFAYVCFTPESSTLIQGTFNPVTWHEVWDVASELYSTESPRPTKITPNQKLFSPVFKHIPKHVNLWLNFLHYLVYLVNVTKVKIHHMFMDILLRRGMLFFLQIA